jgi:hypothetical protein
VSPKDDAADPGPLLRVVNQDATDEEIAALVAVFSSLGQAPAPRKPTPVWAANTRTMRETLRRGPGAWRASGLPR